MNSVHVLTEKMLPVNPKTCPINFMTSIESASSSLHFDVPGKDVNCNHEAACLV